MFSLVIIGKIKGMLFVKQKKRRIFPKQCLFLLILAGKRKTVFSIYVRKLGRKPYLAWLPIHFYA